jgi:hypothetical protein
VIERHPPPLKRTVDELARQIPPNSSYEDRRLRPYFLVEVTSYLSTGKFRIAARLNLHPLRSVKEMGGSDIAHAAADLTLSNFRKGLKRNVENLQPIIITWATDDVEDSGCCRRRIACNVESG